MINFKEYKDNIKEIKLLNDDITMFFIRLLEAYKNLGYITTIKSRVKTFDSINEKMAGNSKKKPKNFEDIKDLIGIRIISINEQVRTYIVDIIEKIFPKASIDKKHDKFFVDKGVKEYSAKNMDVKHLDSYKDLDLLIFDWYGGDHADGLTTKDIMPTADWDIPIEIQFHTLGSDMWTNLVHDTLYKNQLGDFETKVKLSRISASLSVIDEAIGGAMSTNTKVIWELTTFTKLRDYFSFHGYELNDSKPNNDLKIYLKYFEIVLDTTPKPKKMGLLEKFWPSVKRDWKMNKDENLFSLNLFGEKIKRKANDKK